MSNSVMMQPFPKFPQLPIVPSQTLPEATMERRVFILESYFSRMENDFSQRFFDLEGQTEQLKRQMNFIQDQNTNIIGEQIQLSSRIELLRRSVCEHSRQHAETKEELDEIYEDTKIRDERVTSLTSSLSDLLSLGGDLCSRVEKESIVSLEEAMREVSDYCSHVEKDARILRYELRDMNVVVDDLSKKLEDHKRVVSQCYFKNKEYDHLFQMTTERMNDFENATKNIRNVCLESVRELKEKMEQKEQAKQTRVPNLYSKHPGNPYGGESERNSECESEDMYMAGLDAFFEETCRVSETYTECGSDDDMFYDDAFPLANLLDIGVTSALPIAPSISSEIYETEFPIL